MRLGKHQPSGRQSSAFRGSSPRTWGTRGKGTDARSRVRFIPTHVGNTGKSVVLRLGCSVHPHARGEHVKLMESSGISPGSSPRTWGTLGGTGIFSLKTRFIPTHVGNTSSRTYRECAPSVHPHARGEHQREVDDPVQLFGSSPRTWGTLRPCVILLISSRFIPHARGEHEICPISVRLTAGSSPRTWGTRQRRIVCWHHLRFIPTHVGNTPSWLRMDRAETVHPHARGEHGALTDTM